MTYLYRVVLLHFLDDTGTGNDQITISLKSIVKCPVNQVLVEAIKMRKMFNGTTNETDIKLQSNVVKRSKTNSPIVYYLRWCIPLAITTVTITVIYTIQTILCGL